MECGATGVWCLMVPPWGFRALQCAWHTSPCLAEGRGGQPQVWVVAVVAVVQRTSRGARVTIDVLLWSAKSFKMEC